MPGKVCGEITYPFRNFIGCTIEVQEWLSYFIPHIILDVITYPCWDWSKIMLVKWALHTDPSTWHGGLSWQLPRLAVSQSVWSFFSKAPEIELRRWRQVSACSSVKWFEKWVKCGTTFVDKQDKWLWLLPMSSYHLTILNDFLFWVCHAMHTYYDRLTTDCCDRYR